MLEATYLVRSFPMKISITAGITIQMRSWKMKGLAADGLSVVNSVQPLRQRYNPHKGTV